MEEYIPLVFIGLYVGFSILEAVRPGRALPAIKHWRLKGAVSLAIYFFLSGSLPLLWDGWLGEHRVIDATGLGAVGGAVVGFATASR